MANADPPHEVDDRKAPADRNVDAPDADALEEQVGQGEQQHHRHQEADPKADEPSCRGRPRQYDRADFVGDRAEREAGFDDRSPAARDLDVFHSICHDLTALRFELGIGVADLGQVRRPGPRVQVRQQLVIAVLRFPLGDPAVGIVDVAENDGARRARLLAGRLQLAFVPALVDLAPLALGVDAPLVDALDAVRALLHHPAAAHAHVGVAHQLVLRRVPVLEQQEIEPPDFVGAVVRAIARAHAPVVHHVVQAFGAVQGRAHRADQFAGRVLTLHAGHRLKVRPGMVAVALVVGVDTQPVHVPPAHNLLFPHDGDVVLRLAGHDAVVAAHAAIHVDRHAPGIVLLGIIVVRIQRQFARHLLFLRELRLFLVFLKAGFTHLRTAVAVRRVHRLVALGRGQLVGVAGLGELRPSRNPHRGSRAQRVDIETRARPRAPRFLSPVAEEDRCRIIRMPGLDPHRARHLASAHFDRDHVLGLQSLALSHLRPDQHRVVPGQLRHRLGQLLQPAVVGEAPVINRRVAAEIDFKRLGINFRRDPSIYDGRFANNGWLQELPKPMTKLTWDNAVLVGPKMAEREGLKTEDMVTIEVGGRKVTGAVWVQAGHPDYSATVFLGYGRKKSGRAGTGAGFDVYPLRTTSAMWIASGAKLTKTGDTYKLASTQGYQTMDTPNGDSRPQVRETSLEEYKKEPKFAQEEQVPRELTLYPNYDYSKQDYAWGMAIDMNCCVGCNNCIVACQAENNIAVVGKEQVVRGRHMHWLRVDAYYQGDRDHPRAYFQPVPCMQCENAPCELVCPVGATLHSTEGLNDMVYNRCVGTRYCSNNCPYKVRRFNFLLFQDWDTPQYKLMRNPDVSVRSRGVMEKCTYCIQRINERRIDAEREGRKIN